jgi:hypothetical protein
MTFNPFTEIMALWTRLTTIRTAISSLQEEHAKVSEQLLEQLTEARKVESDAAAKHNIRPE